MSKPSPAFELLRSPWGHAFQKLLSKVEDKLILVSPFIKLSQAAVVASQLRGRGVYNHVHVSVLTDLRPESALHGSTDLEAFVQLYNALPKCDLTHLPSLHANVYLADQRMAIITSGNLTDPGIDENIEYGIVSTEESIVRAVRSDLEAYAMLGAKISLNDVHALLGEINELKELYRKAERTIRVRARRVFREKLEATKFEILRHRAKGKSTNAIISETILFLLGKGPLHTIELHPMIKRIHPDLCDDTVDRVIDGVHFGKKWKHHVRNTQQQLKREGWIRFDGERWHLVR